jgi:toxin ParE1/3/4
MSRFRLSRRAGEDIAEIHAYIASDNSAAADRLVCEFFDLFKLLARNSAMGELRDDLRKDLRIMSHSSYAVCFKPISEGVEIVTVLHSSRDIHLLLKRLPE